MIVIEEKNECYGCGACMQKCPRNCIDMESDEEGFLYPRVNYQECIHCGLCKAVCPHNKEKPPQKVLPRAYAINNMDDEVRINSSSGGIFSLLSEKIIQEGGAVFGATYDENFRVIHTCVNKTKDLSKLRGSKYVQSDMGSSYKQVECLLKDGKKVLFSGTPCQIEGLLRYINKEYENLYVVDIICSGVPSPWVWEKNIQYIEKKVKSKITDINLRYKKYGWQEYVIRYKFENGKEYEQSRFLDPYMLAFRKAYSLRPSCYECEFKTVSRRSDITIADCWGIESIAPELYDRKGTSLVFVHSEKGRIILDSLQNNMQQIEVDREWAVSCNPSMCRSAKLPKQRMVYLEKLRICSINKAIDSVFQYECRDLFKYKVDFLLLKVHFLKSQIKDIILGYFR